MLVPADLRKAACFRVRRQHRLLLACALIVAAIALPEVPSFAQLAPSTAQPANRPAAAPAETSTVSTATAEAILRADKGDKEDLPKARKELLDFVAEHPEDLDGLRLLARAYELSPAPADEQSDESSKKFAALARDVWLKAAAIAVKNANTAEAYQEAFRICDQALRRDPLMWPVNLELARLYAKSLRGAQAVDRYTAYLKACREAEPVRVDTQAALELARLHLSMNRWRLAVQVLLDARKDDAANAKIDATLAQAYRTGADPSARGADQVSDRFERGRLLAEAVNAIDEALKKDPRNLDYLLAKVGIRGARNLNDDKNKDLDEAADAAALAVRVTAEALQEKPGDGPLLEQLSRSYDALGATLVARLQRDKNDTAALVHLLRMARRHTDVQREADLRQLLQRIEGAAGEQARNDPAAKALMDEVNSQLRDIQAGAADLPLATRPGS